MRPRFASRDHRKAHRGELRTEIESALAARPAREWESLLNEAGVPAGLVLDVTNSLTRSRSPQRNPIHEVELPDRAVSVLGSGFHVNGEPLQPHSPPPTLCAGTDDLLAEIGYPSEQITELHTQGAVSPPMHGKPGAIL